MRKHTKALATIMAAAALAMVTNSRIPITNIWYYVCLLYTSRCV